MNQRSSIHWGAIVLLVAACNLGCSRTPTDQHLIELLEDQRAVFEELKRMTDEDAGLYEVGLYFSVANGGGSLDPNREKQYQQLMKKIEASRVLKDEDGVFILLGGGWGLYKGIAWSSQRPPDMRENLDIGKREMERHSQAFRHVTDHWYVFLVFTPR